MPSGSPGKRTADVREVKNKALNDLSNTGLAFSCHTAGQLGSRLERSDANREQKGGSNVRQGPNATRHPDECEH